MKTFIAIFCILPLAISLVACHPSPRRDRDGNVTMTGKEIAALNYNHKKSLGYLQEARNFRTQGRYELARQSYVQALSICSDEPTLKIITRELEAINLLLRTMR